MNLIKEIKDADFGFKSKKNIEYTLRRAVRAIVFDKDGKVAILHATKNDYHKIAGGGIEEGEDIKVALEREIYEEVGAKSKIGKEIGLIIEYRDLQKRIQISYCYFAKATSIGKPHFTKDEKDAGFVLQWLTLDEAIKKLKKDDLSTYGAKFMSTRDLAFLKEAKKLRV